MCGGMWHTVARCSLALRSLTRGFGYFGFGLQCWLWKRFHLTSGVAVLKLRRINGSVTSISCYSLRWGSVHWMHLSGEMLPLIPADVEAVHIGIVSLSRTLKHSGVSGWQGNNDLGRLWQLIAFQVLSLPLSVVRMHVKPAEYSSLCFVPPE